MSWQRNPNRVPVEHRETVSRPAKKDKRRWCGGKPGREHEYRREPAWVAWLESHQGFIESECSVMVCVNCGRRDWRTYRKGGLKN